MMSRLQVVALSQANGAVQNAWDSVSWETRQDLNGGLHATPTIASLGDGERIEVLGIGLDDKLWHRSGRIAAGTNKVEFDGWQPIAQEAIAGGIVPASWAVGRLDLFARGAEKSDVKHLWLGGQTSWETLGGVIKGQPTAVAWGADRLDVFGVGSDNRVYHRWWGG